MDEDTHATNGHNSKSTKPSAMYNGKIAACDHALLVDEVLAAQDAMDTEKVATDVHVAHVRLEEGDDHLRLQLRICNDRKTFFRVVNEKLDKLRARLQILASQATDGKAGTLGGNRLRKARNKQDQQHLQSNKIPVRFFTCDNQEIIGKSVTVGDALMRTERIEIGSESFVVLRNQPMVLKITVMNPVLAGIPVVPIPETDFCEPHECSWRWFRVDPDGAETPWCDQRRYVPSQDDLGFHFRIECRAPSMGSGFAHESAAEVTTTTVVPGPDRTVFEPRRLLGRTRASTKDKGAFRIMSYNVLFDGYTTSVQAKTEIFPYVKPEVLQEMYRMQLVFQEIEESNADIVCLQEMGQNTFESFFEPMMKPIGYHTFYTGKTGTTQEGCAVLVRKDVFEVVEERMVNISQAVRNSQNSGIQELLGTYPEFEKGLKKIPSVAQLIILKDKRDPTKRIILANTHLFYREDADMIRLVQAVVTVREIERVRAELTSSHTGSVGVVFCGDFNAFPDTACVGFLLNGSIDDRHRHWKAAPAFKWKRNAASEATPVTFQEPTPSAARACIAHSLNLLSACGIPDFTNFAGSFVGTLDYILLSQRELLVRQVFPLFTREAASTEVALPSTTFPSDHISLIADVQWAA